MKENKAAAQGAVKDYIEFYLPDGTRYAFALDSEGWGLYGFYWHDGEWNLCHSGRAMEDSMDVSLVRHSTSQIRPDGSAYPNDLGFDIVSAGSAARLSYHYDGNCFNICGWYDPARYAGEVMIKGTVLEYYDGTQTAPADAVDMGGWMSDWSGYSSAHPATPQEARELAAIFEENVRDLFPGYTMQYYASFNGGTLATASYYRLTDGLLNVKRVDFRQGGVIDSQADTMSVPLSGALLARMKTEPADSLIDTSGTGSIFLVENALDTHRLPVSGRVIQSDLQSGGLVLLVEDSAENRRVQVFSMKPDGSYFCGHSTFPLPRDAYLDLFHSTDGEISFSWDDQHCSAIYSRSSNGEWLLSWARFSSMSTSFEYSGTFCGVTMQGSWHQGNEEHLLLGSLPCSSLRNANLEALPQTEAALKNSLSRKNWAVVSNPNSKARLHLRTSPSKGAESLGKFYNGTPLRVLAQRGDWTQVAIGLDGLTGWMSTRFLAFGDEMDQVVPAFPQKIYLEELENRQPSYQAKDGKEEKALEGSFHIVGVVEDELYVLLTDLGGTGYVPQAWMWDGNG
ncbi:MAG: SH3 domain-containing protein [Clostridiales bacterium]|nr:SH3 domain-containing protein [Clostridiales bacterium]